MRGKAKARAKKRSEPSVLFVSWSPAAKGQSRPFDPTSYAGSRMQDLAGKPLEYFAALENLNDLPVDPEYPPPEARLLARSIEILRKYPLLPVVLVGRATCRAFGLDAQLGRTGYLTWFNTGERPVAVMPHPSNSRWWSRPGNVEATRLFLRSLSEARALVPFPDGSSTEAIDLEELESICEQWAPTVAEVAAHFKVSERTMYRRLNDPEYRGAWERGHAKARISLRRARMRKALHGGQDGLGDASMQKFLSAVLLGERVDESGRVHIHLTNGSRSDESDEQPITITRRQLEETIREVNAEFEIIEDREILPAETR